MEGSSTSASKGSNGMFTGTFSPVVYAEYLLEQYPKLLNQALKEEAKAQQQSLQKQASELGNGWEDLADKLRVKYNAETGTYTYRLVGGNRIQKKAMALEYGTPQQAPTPLLRTNILEKQQDVGTSIATSINTGIGKSY